MNLNFKDIITVTMILFAIIDTMGNIPVILSLRKKVGHIQSEKATLVAGIIMIVFLFVGESILKLIGVDISSFAVAGSFILFILALEMIMDIQIMKDESPKTASIIPIAFPLVAGPGALTSLLTLRAEYDVSNIICAIVLNLILVYVVLKSSAKIERILGKQGINVIRKVFGVILLAITVKLFTTNIQNLF